MENIKATPYPIYEIYKGLERYFGLFTREESIWSLCRYIVGLLADIARKTCQGIADAVPGTSSQRLQEFLTNTKWDHDSFNRQRVEYMSKRATYKDGSIIIDDTGLVKQGKGSCGVARQYSGTLGKVGNCQVIVSTQYADDKYNWPVNARLYLPEEWANNPDRRKKCHIPEDVQFMTKTEIALCLVDEADEAGVPYETVIFDAGYGRDQKFLDGLEERGKKFVGGIPCDFQVRVPGEIEEAAKNAPPYKRKLGRPRKEPYPNQVAPRHRVDDIAKDLPESAWETITWREGSKGLLTKQFAFMRVHRTTDRRGTGPIGWLICERPLPGHEGEWKWYFSNLPEDTSHERLVRLAHRRHEIERYYEDAKDELGLDHYEGRLWHGLHRHLILVMWAYSWLALRRRPKVEYEANKVDERITSSDGPVEGGFSPLQAC